jgi:hypothetical protein
MWDGQATKMVDRVYAQQIPALRKTLERLKGDFSKLTPRTDWTELRVDPLLVHARQLEQSLASWKSIRLTRGVRMLHSDLVYLRENVKALEQALESERVAFRRINRK